MNEVTLKLETIIVEPKSIKTNFTHTIGEFEFGMSESAYRWYIRKYKNNRFIKRLKNKTNGS